MERIGRTWALLTRSCDCGTGLLDGFPLVVELAFDEDGKLISGKTFALVATGMNDRWTVLERSETVT